MVYALQNLCVAALLAVALLPALPLSGAVALAADCRVVSPVSVTELINSHKIRPWPEIKAMAGFSGKYTDVASAIVCQQGGKLYYIVNVRGPRGDATQMSFDAVTGARQQ